MSKSQPVAHTVTAFPKTLDGDQVVGVGMSVAVGVAVGRGVSVDMGIAVGDGVGECVGVVVGPGAYGDETGLVTCETGTAVGDSGTDVGSGFPQPAIKSRTIVTTTTVL